MADARKAMAALQKFMDDQNRTAVSRDAVMPIKPVEKDFQVLKNAVEKGDPAAALMAIKQVVQGALKAETEASETPRVHRELSHSANETDSSDETPESKAHSEGESASGAKSEPGSVLNVKV